MAKEGAGKAAFDAAIAEHVEWARQQQVAKAAQIPPAAKVAGEMIRKARERVGKSKQAVAEETGVVVRSVERYEAGQHFPSGAAAWQLAAALGLSDEQVLELGRQVATARREAEWYR
jgi:ribosome-binding protein aMBF1 (putative translation factor)